MEGNCSANILNIHARLMVHFLDEVELAGWYIIDWYSILTSLWGILKDLRKKAHVKPSIVDGPLVHGSCMYINRVLQRGWSEHVIIMEWKGG